MIWECMKTLSGLPGVSGCEDAVRNEILHWIDGYCDYKVDVLGNIIAFKKGKHPAPSRKMFSAHMDEVGLIVTYVEDSGLLRFATVGGIDPRSLAGKKVVIGGIPGVIGTKAMHQKSEEERGKAAAIQNMYIDIGAKDKEQAENAVKPGHRAVFCSRYLEFGDGKIQGKALDDRVGCALLIHLIRSDLPVDTHFVFTVQEETGGAGAKTAAAQIQPEIGIVLEATTACDIPDTPENKQVCRLGQGPVLSFMDKGTVYDMELYQKALSLARINGIRCQSKLGVYGGNESRSIQTAGDGTKVLAVSLPCRYLHTQSCVLCRSDVEETVKLLYKLL